MHRIFPTRLAGGAGIIVIALIAVAAVTTSKAEAASASGTPGAGAIPVPGSAALPLAMPGIAKVTAALPGDRVTARALDRKVIESAEAALRAVTDRVKRSSHADALRTAFQAYYNFRYTNPDAVRKPFLYYVDMGLDNRTARGYVFDMDRLTVIEGPFTVAHGRGSARTRDAVPSSFSNRPGSNATSLGLYLAQETYSFNGKLAGRRYSAVGLRMRGESREFNGAARARGIVAHGAPYVTAAGAGRSEGCPAMEMDRARRLLPMIANGGVVFIYSPNDSRWLSNDPWILDA
jgi:hypothetical protein